MTEIQGMELDFTQMSGDDWTLYFTSGTYQSTGVQREVEPAVLKIVKADYEDYQLEIFDVFYNPINNNYSTVLKVEDTETQDCSDYGYHLGGYLVNGCELKYIYPSSDCVEYVRPFGDEYDTGYVDETSAVEACSTNRSEFNFDFSLDYKTTGLDYTPTSGLKEIDATEFDSSFATV